jgi:hypothetical protein
LFRCVAASGARALLIGRQAMIALGLPVLTGDYDDWVHPDDLERFNVALREEQRLANGATLTLPSLDDLIATKRLAGRAKDLEDLRLLEILRRGRAS